MAAPSIFDRLTTALRGFGAAFARSEAPAIKANELTKEVGTPRVGGVISAHRQGVIDRLTPDYLATVIKGAVDGDAEAYLTLAEEMEEREPHYRSVLGTRKLGVSGAPVFVESSGDSGLEKQISDDVESTIVRDPRFEGLVLDLLDGIPKGFSCSEILWQRDAKRWVPGGYEFRPQRHFVFDQETLSRPLLRTDGSPNGEELAPYKWIVHKPKLLSGVPLRGGLAITVAVSYAAKRYTLADWLTFLDVYGIPVRVGKYPANLANRKKALLEAISRIGTDAACVIPEEMSLELLNGANSSGAAIFQGSAEYHDKQISKVVLGQTMTSDDGASLAQSKTHERVRFDIRKADARAVAATINRDLIKPFVDLNYGVQRVYPSVVYKVEEPEDITALANVAKVLVDMGAKIQASEVRDRCGFAEPDEGAELLVSASKLLADANAANDSNADPNAQDSGAKNDGPANGNDAIKPDKKNGGKTAQRNRAGFAAAPKTSDVIDEISTNVLAGWEDLTADNIGRIIEELQAATSLDEVRTKLDELEREAGDRIDIEPIVKQLATQTLKVRGVGDATDSTDP